MTKLILNGACGFMGRVIAGAVSDNPNFEIVCGFDIKADSATTFPVYSKPSDFQGKADVIIDFSHPSSLTSILDYAVKSRTPIVVCTTGLSEEQKGEIAEASKSVAVFYSANMSVGISLITKLAKEAMAALGEDFDIEIVEAHHNRKLDAPSGTALAIAGSLNENNSHDFVYERQSKRQKREKSEIGIHSVRGGTIVGEHTVIFAGKDEVIEIKHSAASREIFATGAIRAAEFLAGKSAGMYSMSDVVSL